MKPTTLLSCALALYLQAGYAQVTLDLAKRYQTIEGFAASDCWTGHYVGKYWDEATKNTIARYLFSRNQKADGSPEGIGLSMWRVNLGAGTAEQGAASDIADVARRSECFLGADGSYDWTKQEGQQWLMRQAKEYGCESFVLFSNSPPVFYTRNGKGYANGDGSANLQADKYDDFAEFMATVAQHFLEEGIPIAYISPVNEPQYDWQEPSQEGSPWSNGEIKKLAVELSSAIAARKLSTKILLAEAGAWGELYQGSGRASNQIYQLFDAGSANYIGHLAALAPVVGGHSYWSHSSDAQLRSVRTSVRSKAEEYGLGVFQTEWSLLGDGFLDYDKASYMDIALYMAKIIHSDLAFANVSSWSYWTSMGVELWGHKNRFLLIALAPGGSVYNPITQPGTATDMPTLWALGNYSYFIRPGYRRIDLAGADNLGGLMGTAYLSPDSSQIVAVYVNYAGDDKQLTTAFLNTSGRIPATAKSYVTSASHSLRKAAGLPFDGYSAAAPLTVPARSVTTAVYELGSAPGETPTGVGAAEASKLRAYPNPAAASQSVTVELPGAPAGRFSMSIYSIAGQLVYEENRDAPPGASATLRLPARSASGVYVLKAKCGEKVYREKLIVTARGK
ncbi:MAG: T9SS type A sorting domain-containing protein [Prevotellaceae bacterium]|jgi:O-glycosyl hydrolase|nr:T9SS type A sorting domain-containing protein [Prevotellaceae bacterium]